MAEEYPDFVKNTGYGTGEGLCGWNCRHSFFPFYPGISKPHYTAEALAALNEKDVTYQGKRYTRYEISQMQRALERQVRAAKRKCMAEEAAGLSRGQFPVGPTGANAGHVMPGKGIVTKFGAFRAELQAAAELKEARQKLTAFVKDTGGKENAGRTLTPGFGKVQAEKSNEAVKNLLTNAAGKPILEVKRVELTGAPGSITQRTNAKGGIDRHYYGPDGAIAKQISNNGHGFAVEEKHGVHGEHAHDYFLNEKGIPVHGPSRELTQEEREENGDIL